MDNQRNGEVIPQVNFNRRRLRAILLSTVLAAGLGLSGCEGLRKKTNLPDKIQRNSTEVTQYVDESGNRSVVGFQFKKANGRVTMLGSGQGYLNTVAKDGSGKIVKVSFMIHSSDGTLIYLDLKPESRIAGTIYCNGEIILKIDDMSPHKITYTQAPYSDYLECHF